MAFTRLRLRGLAACLLTLAAPLAEQASAAPAAVPAAQVVYPGASQAGLVPPPGMTPATGFAGFEHRSGASMVMLDMPGHAYDEIAGRFTARDLAPTGFVMEGTPMPFTATGGKGLIVRGRQPAHGQTYRKWIAILRDGARAAMVTVQVPPGDSVRDADVEAALKSIAFRPVQSPAEQLAALPFRIGDLAGFRVVRSFAANGLLLTDGPLDVDPDAVQPMVIVARSLGPVRTAGQEEAFARKAMTSFDRLAALHETGARRYVQGGVPAVRLEGEGQNASNGRAMKWSQTILFHDGGYSRVVAFAPLDKVEALAHADRLAATVTPR